MAVAALAQKHDELQQQLQQKRSGAKTDGAQDAAAAMLHLSESTKTLVDYGKRIQEERELSEIYHEWVALVDSRLRSSLYGVLQCALWILLICLGSLTGTHYIGRLSKKLAPEKNGISSRCWCRRAPIRIPRLKQFKR
jgi:hypothetical protein